MTFNINLLSKYRSQLMGIAILLIALFHSGYSSPNFEFINWMRRVGYIGVEIFLLVSGIGMYYSLKGSDKLVQFYTKRLLRIMPLYIPIIFIFGWRYDFSWVDYILNITTLSFWVNTPLFNWYVPAIVLLYLLTPFYMKVFNKKPLVTTLVAIALSFPVMYLLPQHVYIFTCRLPIFFIGIYTGKLCYDKAQLGIKSLLVLFVAFIVGIVLFKTKLTDSDLELTLIVPFMVIALCALFSVFKNYKFPALAFLGNYSLAIYLLYDLIADTFRRDQVGNLTSIMPQWGIEIFILSLTILTAYIFQRAMYAIVDRLKIK